MEGSVLAQILASAGVAAALGAIINGFYNRKKLGAEATSIITQAAGGLVKSLQEDNARLRAEDVRRKVQAERRERANRRRDAFFREALEKHFQYDRELAALLRRAGLDAPQPPTVTFPELDEFYDDEEEIFIHGDESNHAN